MKAFFEAAEARHLCMIAGKVMMEGVVHELEAVRRPEVLDCRDRFRLGAQRRTLESERLDKRHHVRLFEHRLDLAQRQAEVGLALALAHALAVVARDQADRLGTTGDCGLDKGRDLGSHPLRPVVERIDLRQSDDAEPHLPHAVGDRLGRLVIKEWPTEIVAELHADTAELTGERDEFVPAQLRCGHVIYGETEIAHGSGLPA